MDYKGYVGQFTYDEKLDLFQGSVCNIKDLIIFQGKSIESLKYAFKDAVNEYLDWCKKNGRAPEKPSLKTKSSNRKHLFGFAYCVLEKFLIPL
jgi:predicted HicB family RNase H-like nuclease